MQSFTKLAYKKKVVRKDHMLLLTGAEVLQSSQRQAVVIMRNTGCHCSYFLPKVGSPPRYQILHLPRAACPSSADCEVELPEVQWNTATTYAGGKKQGRFGPLCFLVQFGFWYTLLTEKEKKNLLLLCLRFPLCSTNLKSFPKSYCNTKTRSLGRNL